MRRLSASILLGLAALAGTLAWTSFTVTSTLLDPTRTDRVAEVLVTDPAVRSSVEEALTRALIDAVPPSTTVADAELRLAAERAFDDPRVQAALRGAIAAAHRRLLGDGAGPIPVDAGAIAVAGRDALLGAHPELAAVLPAPPPLTVSLPVEGFPDLGGIREAAAGVPATAARAGAVVLVAAFAVAAERWRVVRRAGAFGLWTGGGWFLLGWVVPWVVSQWSVDGRLAVLGSLALAVAGPMVVPAAALVVSGAVCLWLSFIWSRLSASRQAESLPGAAGAPLWQPVNLPKVAPPPLAVSHRAGRSDGAPLA